MISADITLHAGSPSEIARLGQALSSLVAPQREPAPKPEAAPLSQEQLVALRNAVNRFIGKDREGNTERLRVWLEARGLANLADADSNQMPELLKFCGEAG